MAVSFYLPKDINDVIKKVVDEGSTKSPNYISNPVVSPSVLKRNLQKVENLGSKLYDFNVVPLTLPSTHSTGNVQNARTFDYDFVVANTDPVNAEPIFITDVGSYSFQVEFKSKSIDVVEISNPSTGLSEEVTYHRYLYDIVDSNIDPLLTTFKTATAFKASSFENVEEKTLGQSFGDVSVKVLKAYDLPMDQTKFLYDSTAQQISLDVKAEMDTELDDKYKKITLLVSVGSEDEFSKLRLAGGVTYQPSLDSFYTNKNITTTINNLRDYLVAANVEDYLGYSIILQPYQGLLFNLEIGTLNDTTFTFNDVTDFFEISKLRLFNDVSELFSGQSLLVTTEGNISEVKVSTSNFDPANDINETFTGGTTRQWVDFFKQFGMTCRVYFDSGKVTRLFLDRIDNTRTSLDIKITVYSSSESVLQVTPNFHSLAFNDLPGTNSNTSVLSSLSTSSVTGDGTHVRNITLSKSVASRELAPNVSYIGTKKINAVKLKLAPAPTHDYTDYSNTTNELTYISERTSKLIAYGFEGLLQTIAQNIRDNLSYLAAVDKDKGIVYVSNKGATTDNLYVGLKYSDYNVDPIVYTEDSQDGPYNLVVDNKQSVVNKSEAFIRMDKTGTEDIAVVDNNCSYIILDEEHVNNLPLNIQPFAYRVMNSKVEEQITYKQNIASATTSTLFKDLLNGISPFFLAIIPLYNGSGVFTNKYALRIDSVKVDDKVMKNILVWSDSLKTGLTSGYLATYQGLIGYVDGAPMYEEITPVRNSSILFAGPYLSLNTGYGVVNKYGTSLKLSVNFVESTFKITTTTLDGASEDCTFTVTPTSTLADIISQSTLTNLVLTSETGKLVVSVKPTSTEQRIRVTIDRIDSEIEVADSKLVLSNTDSIICLLNKGA